jgi:hypothetical protein
VRQLKAPSQDHVGSPDEAHRRHRAGPLIQPVAFPQGGIPVSCPPPPLRFHVSLAHPVRIPFASRSHPIGIPFAPGDHLISREILGDAPNSRRAVFTPRLPEIFLPPKSRLESANDRPGRGWQARRELIADRS